jgi:hypothetical protein
MNKEFFTIMSFWNALTEFRALVFVVKKAKMEDKMYEAQ